MYKRYEMRRMAGVPMEVITSRTDLPIEFVTWDLSPQGAYLMTEAKPVIGDQVVCSFSLDDAAAYCFFAEVARVNRGRRAGDAGPKGFALRFLDPTPMERLRIRGALRGLVPTMPSPRRDNALTQAMGWSKAVTV